MAWRLRDSQENQNESNELSHYGVLGMRWGVRKDRETSGKKKISSPTKTKGDVDTKTIETNVGTVKIDGYDASDKRQKNQYNDWFAEEDPDRYVTSTKNKLALEQLPIQDEFEDGRVFDFIPKSKTSETMEKNLQAYLTNHDAPTYMRSINCFECTMAYEMRRRGYDVQSKEMAGGYDPEWIRAFDIKQGFDIKVDPIWANPTDEQRREMAKEAYNQMAERCLAFGEGARGSVGISYYDREGGHSMAWVVENGEFKILDTQHNGENGYETFLHADVSDRGVNSTHVYRLDNAEVLPGVTDYVEAFEYTDEEKDAMEEAKKKLEEKAKRYASPSKTASEADKKETESVLKSISNNVVAALTTFIDEGKNMITNLFTNLLNIQDSEPKTTVKKK